MSRLLLSLIFLCALTSRVSAQQHMFTNKEGVQINAEIESVQLDWKVMTIRKDGKAFTIEPKVLVLDDQQFVKTWLKGRGIMAPNETASAPVPPPTTGGSPAALMPPPGTEVNVSGIHLEVDLKRKLTGSDRKKYSTYMRLETKNYSFDITLTNRARETVPPVKVSYAVVWKEGVSFSDGSYTTFSGTGDKFAVKGEKTFPQLVYNRDVILSTEPVEINSVVYDGNEHYMEDLLLGVVVNVELANGTKIIEFLSTDAKSAGLTWDIVKDLPALLGVVAVAAAANIDPDLGPVSLQLQKGQRQEGPISLSGKRISISATVKPDTKSPDGVVVAIGGSVLGMSLYVKDRIVYGSVSNPEGTKLVSKPTPLGDFTATLDLDKEGLSLSLNGASPAKRSDVELFTGSCKDGIDVGRDTGKLAGSYPEDFDFAGQIENATILIRE